MYIILGIQTFKTYKGRGFQKEQRVNLQNLKKIVMVRAINDVHRSKIFFSLLDKLF